MTDKWFDQDFWDDNFDDFDDQDLQEILEEATADLAILIHGLRSDDHVVIAKNAHKIVSVCGNFGYLQCATLAANVEQQVKEGRLADEANKLLIEMVERVTSELRNKGA